jgi:two-component system chemotaxis response regulator CheY
MMHILVVDDSKAMRMIVRRTLRLAGFRVEVSEAASAQEALQVLKDQPIDLVLCDWNMPETTGLELLEKIRSGGNKVKFGFVTSECSVEMRTAAGNAGALFMITKPFTADAFQKTLEPVVGSN